MFLFSTPFCQISCNLIENTELTILYDAEFSFFVGCGNGGRNVFSFITIWWLALGFDNAPTG